MPELPEVETVVVTLRPRVIGKAVIDVVVHRQDVITPIDLDFRNKLQGRTIIALDRRGKRIVFTLDTDERFYVHLGMTGRLIIERPDAETLKHTHLLLKFDGFEVRFRDPRRFGGVWWLGRADPGEGVMGPEPLTLRSGQLHKLLATTKRAIKVALLDQHLIAGLGNIYVDEALHASGIHPLTPANKVTAKRAGTLTQSIKTVLKRAIRSGGSSLRDYVDANGVGGGYQKLHHVYDRKGQPCRGCTTPIKRIVLGGRSTHFCPNCQTRSGRRTQA